MSKDIEFESIHDEIAIWHKSSCIGHKTNKPLNEYLGLSPAEYAILVENPEKFEAYLNYLKDINGRI